MSMFVASALMAEIMEDAMWDQTVDFEDVLSICSEVEEPFEMEVCMDTDEQIITDVANAAAYDIMVQAFGKILSEPMKEKSAEMVPTEEKIAEMAPPVVEEESAPVVATPAIKTPYNFLPSVGTWQTPFFRAAAPTMPEAVVEKAAEPEAASVKEPEAAPVRKDFKFLASVGTWLAPSFVAADEPPVAVVKEKAVAPLVLPIKTETAPSAVDEEPTSPSMVLAGTPGRSLMKIKKSLSSGKLNFDMEDTSFVQGAKHEVSFLSKKPSTVKLIAGFSTSATPAATPAWMLDLVSSEVPVKQVFKAPTSRQGNRASSVGSISKRSTMETAFAKGGLLPAISPKSSVSQWTVSDLPALRQWGK